MWLTFESTHLLAILLFYASYSSAHAHYSSGYSTPKESSFFISATDISTDPNMGFNLPVFPNPLPSKQLGNVTHTDKLIPRHLWIAMRDKNEPLNVQLPGLFARNPKWEVHIVGNYEKDLFMNTTFANTSLLWAYHALSPAVGAAKADIWRYATLWTYGGAYIDDDSDMKDPLDKMVEPLDELIVAYENNGFNGDTCYIPRYHLSDFYTFARNETAKKQNLFMGRILLNWAIVSAPRHPILARVMENIVEIIKHEYHSESVLRTLNFAYRWAAGPTLLTASAREYVLALPPSPSSGYTYKLARTDFKDYGGKFKAISVRVRDDPKHYMNMHKNKDTTLMAHKLPEQPVSLEVLKKWQGTAIQGQNGKEIFVVDNGKKRGIPNYDTFIALNFTMADVRVLSDVRIAAIETGASMPSLMVRRN